MMLQLNSHFIRLMAFKTYFNDARINTQLRSTLTGYADK